MQELQSVNGSIGQETGRKHIAWIARGHMTHMKWIGGYRNRWLPNEKIQSVNGQHG